VVYSPEGSKQIVFPVALRKVITQNKAFSFLMWSLLHVCAGGRPNARSLRHKRASGNTYLWYSLIRQNFLVHPNKCEVQVDKDAKKAFTAYCSCSKSCRNLQRTQENWK